MRVVADFTHFNWIFADNCFEIEGTAHSDLVIMVPKFSCISVPALARPNLLLKCVRHGKAAVGLQYVNLVGAQEKLYRQRD